MKYAGVKISQWIVIGLFATLVQLLITKLTHFLGR
jgi:hypothetical protein